LFQGLMKLHAINNYPIRRIAIGWLNHCWLISPNEGLFFCLRLMQKTAAHMTVKGLGSFLREMCLEIFASLEEKPKLFLMIFWGFIESLIKLAQSFNDKTVKCQNREPGKRTNGCILFYQLYRFKKAAIKAVPENTNHQSPVVIGLGAQPVTDPISW